MSVGGHQGDDLILDHLHALNDLIAHPHFCHAVDSLLVCLLTKALVLPTDIPPELFPAHLNKRCQMGERDALSAVLGAGDLGNDLRGNIARCGETVGLFDHGLTDDRAVLQHVLQIDQTAVVHVLCEVVRIMEVDDTGIVRLGDIVGQQEPCGNVLADFTCHVVPLYAVDHRILVGVLLLYFFVFKIQQAENLPVCGIGLAL